MPGIECIAGSAEKPSAPFNISEQCTQTLHKLEKLGVLPLWNNTNTAKILYQWKKTN